MACGVVVVVDDCFVSWLDALKTGAELVTFSAVGAVTGMSEDDAVLAVVLRRNRHRSAKCTTLRYARSRTLMSLPVKSY